MVGKNSQEEPIYVARIPGLPRNEDIQTYLRESGAELVAVYSIFTGVPQGTDLAVDGIELMFKMPHGRMPLPNIIVGGLPSRVYVGTNLTELYRQ